MFIHYNTNLENILRNEIIESKDIMYYYFNYKITDKEKITVVTFPTKTHQHYIYFWSGFVTYMLF